MPNTQEDIVRRIEALEAKSMRPISIPVELETKRNLEVALDRTVVTLLTPLETAAANEGTHTLLNNTPCIQFADAATREAYFALPIKPNTAVSSIRFIWSTPATSGNLYWQIDFGAGADSEATNARTAGGTAIATAADGTANDLNFTEVTGAAGVKLSTLVSAKEQIVGVKFSRLGADASDTLSNTVNLYGLLISSRLFV